MYSGVSSQYHTKGNIQRICWIIDGVHAYFNCHIIIEYLWNTMFQSVFTNLPTICTQLYQELIVLYNDCVPENLPLCCACCLLPDFRDWSAECFLNVLWIVYSKVIPALFACIHDFHRNCNSQIKDFHAAWKSRQNRSAKREIFLSACTTISFIICISNYYNKHCLNTHNNALL